MVGLDDEVATYWAGRATLCASPDDIARYDQVFADAGSPTVCPDRRRYPAGSAGRSSPRSTSRAARGTVTARPTCSGRRPARPRCCGTATSPRCRRPRRPPSWPCSAPCVAPTRAAGRRAGASGTAGEIDARRTLRRQLQRMGEPGRLEWRRRGTQSRRVVMLIDVSGSMSSYADSLLRLAHRWSVGRTNVEVFTMGTRLTHVTRAMRQRDPDRALIAAGDVVPDWSGGTRLGESLKAFLDRWGQRGMARGAVVVIFSDGWERGGVDLLDEQMRRLRSLAHRRRLGQPAPRQGGVPAHPAGHRRRPAALRRPRRGPLAAHLRGPGGGGRPCVRSCPTCCAGGATARP